MNRIVLLFLFFPGILLAQNLNPKDFGIKVVERPPKGLQVGENAPMFNVKDNHGNKINLKQILVDSEAVIIIFYRGQWCTECTQYLSNIGDSLTYLEERYVKLIAISPETIENAIKTEFKVGSYFTIIPNGNKIMSDYDVDYEVTPEYQRMIRYKTDTDIKENNNQTKAQLPITATYIINQEGKIIFKQFNFDYTKRASVKEMLNAL